MFCEVESEFWSPQVFNNDKSEILSQCRTCLSMGRRLQPLGDYAWIYLKITSDLDISTWIENIQVCWECHKLLQKVALFRQRVEKANELFLTAQNNTYGSLSSLTTVIVNDSHPHTVYVNEQTCPQTVVKCELLNQVDVIEFEMDEGLSEVGDIGFSQTSLKEEQNVTTEEKLKTKPKLSRWAEKRKLENSKPKYKIVTKEKHKFRRVQIDFQELLTLKKERTNHSMFQCQKCVMNFSSESIFVRHNRCLHSDRLEKNSNIFICDVCSAHFKRKRWLLEHIKKHYFKFMCNVCEYSTFYRQNMSKHVRNKHKHVLECLKCGLKFGHTREFYKHHKDYHERFVCDLCGVSFKMRYCIKEHIKKQHGKFECSVCGAGFARYNGLWLHNKTRHARAAAAAYCVDCDKHYVDIYRYRWHLANSVKHKPIKKNKYPCQGCDKVFTKNIYMKDHYNFVHLKQFKYHCDTCDKNFVRNPDLVKHRKRVHEGILPPKNKICYICGRGFSTNKILLNHIRTHTGERPFVCELCPAAFAQSTALRAHSRAIHHSETA